MSKPQKKILIHLQRPPIPVQGGDQQRVLGILKYFKERKDFFKVDAVGENGSSKVWTLEKKQEVLKFVDNLFIYEGKHNLYESLYFRSQRFYFQKLLKQRLPVDCDLSHFTSSEYIKFVKNLLSQRTYDAIWINYMRYAYLALKTKSSQTKTLIDIHDIRSQGRLDENKFHFKELNFDFESNLMREIRLLKQFDTVIVNSHQEMAILKSYIPSQKLWLVPHSVDEATQTCGLLPYPDREFKYDLLFVGTDRGPNRDGINFFLSSIFPIIVGNKPDTRLALAGRIAEVVEIDGSLAGNVDLIGYVPTLTEVYSKSRVVICPLLYGAGTKVKLQEAMAYEIPIVTTTVGASGMSFIDGVNAFITDDSVLFARQTLRLLNYPELAQNFSEELTKTFKSYYSSLAVYSKLDQMLNVVFP